MTNKTLTLGHSPDPDDAFMFYALATDKINPAAVAGLMEGNAGQVVKQFIGTGAVAVYTFAVSFVLFKILGVVMGLRADAEAEDRGLDISLHGEEAYAEAAA